jgi:superfamily II DNA or RNA helicase
VDGHISHFVYFGGSSESWFDEADLEVVPEHLRLRYTDRAEFLRRLVIAKLTANFSDVMYAYRASRTNFEAYQFKPVLKFIGMDTPGMLIADEVGLGKTIEAAIIYLELKARANLQRVLVVCPANLLRKWQSELLLRFDEDFAILDRTLLQAFIQKYEATEGHARLQAIVSLESIRAESIRELLTDAGVHFDLVIFDEAHHLRNRETQSHQIAESLANLSDRILLLTATPLQTREQDLFSLLQLAAPGDFQSYDLFEAQLRPNAHLNRAIHALGQRPPDRVSALAHLEELRGVPFSEGIVRNPFFEEATRALADGKPSSPREVVTMRRDLQLLNTIGHVYTRTKKRDVTGVAKRQAKTVEVVLTPPEREFYESVMEWVRASTRRSTGGWGVVGFNLVNRERQAASCMPAARDYLVDLVRQHFSDLAMESTDTDLDQSRALADSATVAAAVRLLDAAKAIEGIDSKYDRFSEALNGALATDPSAKLIVFSFFKRTLGYLADRLHREGHAPLLITGDVHPRERARLLEEFRDDPNRHILLSSEVGAEGLDFQFAYMMFNYDLPWNPMRVEQRIGRIDRYGQTRPKVFIFNLILQDTIESRILARLYDRIRVFEESVGDLEPIIGDVIQFLTEHLFDHRLTPAEEKDLAHQVDLRISQREDDMKEFESRRSELMGEDKLFEETVTDRVTTGRYVSAAELVALIQPWLSAAFPKTKLLDNLDDTTWHMRGDPDLAAHLSLGKFGEGGQQDGRTFLQRIRAGDIVPLTFDPQMASARNTTELLHPRHPLTRAAVDYWSTRFDEADVDEVGDLVIAEDPKLAGEYDFYVYKLTISGARPALTLEAAALRPDGTEAPHVARSLLRILVSESAETGATTLDEDMFRAQRARAEQIAQRIRRRREREAIRRNEALIALRREAIIRAEDAKIANARRRLETETNERIIRMKTREIENVEASKRARLRDLEGRRQVLAEIQEIAAGHLVLVPRPADLNTIVAPAAGSEARLRPRTKAPRRSPRPVAVATPAQRDGVSPTGSRPAHAAAPAAPPGKPQQAGVIVPSGPERAIARPQLQDQPPRPPSIRTRIRRLFRRG